jgi:outer membrane receptor protein involved in Fe transport
MPWEKRLDLNLTYTPNLVKGLALKVDVFNALNSQSPLAEYSEYSAGDQTIMASDYREVRYYQTPRSMRFTVEYNHKF